MNNTPSLLGEPLVVNLSSPATNPKVVGLSDGNILVAYADEIGGSNRFRIRGRVIAPDGSLSPGEITFNFARSIDEDEFDITALANTHVAVVVEVAKGDDDIEIESGLFRVGASAATDDGGFIVFYDQDRSGDFRIRGQRFDAVGVPVGEDFTVANENGFRLDATGLRNGQAAICYQLSSGVKLAILDASSDAARIEASTSDTPALAGA